MDSEALGRLRKQVGGPRDGALLRVSIGNVLLAAGDAAGAALEFRAALEFDANYSAAWKFLGRALTETQDFDEAIQVYAQGIASADRCGDVQARKEMEVFLRRLRNRPPG